MLLSTLIGSNYPCLELIFMVPKVFEPLKFDCIRINICKYNRTVQEPSHGNLDIASTNFGLRLMIVVRFRFYFDIISLPL